MVRPAVCHGRGRTRLSHAGLVDCAGELSYPAFTIRTMTVPRRWRFYKTASGRAPVREFLSDPMLPSDDRAEVVAAMKDVQINGLLAARHLRDDIYEVRAEGRRVSYRLLFATDGSRSQSLLALSVFSKKCRRTPPEEIGLADARLSEWRARGRPRSP